MKKDYEAPKLDLITFSSEDIVTASGFGGGGGADIVTPEDEF